MTARPSRVWVVCRAVAIMIAGSSGFGALAGETSGLPALRLPGRTEMTALAVSSGVVPDATSLMNWAEVHYPEFFPGHQTNQSFPPYIYRFYPQTGNYLGVSGTSIYILGPVAGSNQTPLYVGELASFGCQVNPSTCYDPSAVVVRKLSSTVGFSLAVRSDGSVLSWGTGMVGGVGPSVPGTAATQVAGADSIVAIAGSGASAGGRSIFSYALKSDGTVVGWGSSDISDQLGIFVKTIDPIPVLPNPAPIPQLSPAVDVKSFMGINVLARHADGSVWIVPGVINYSAQSVAALQVQGIGQISYLGDAWMGDDSRVSVAPLIDSQGAVVMLRITNARFGPDVSRTSSAVYSYSVVSNLPVMVGVSCAGTLDSYTCIGVSADGEVWAWGTNNSSGQIGDGTTSGRTIPVKLQGLSDVAQVANNRSNSFAVTQSGAVYAWGAQSNQLGWPVSNCSTCSRVPVQLPGLSGVVEISASTSNILVRKSDGTVWGWGDNARGELATGSTARSRVPVQAVGINLN